MIPRKHSAKTYTSKSPTSIWNSNNDIKIFTHVSDIHLSKCEQRKVVNTRVVFQTMKRYKANFHIISGDLVDNYGKEHFPKIGRQIEEDWILYKNLLKEEMNNEVILDVAGNHDVWAIIDPLSSQNRYLDYSSTFNRSNVKTVQDFWAKKVVVDGITFILLNNYRFPTSHPPYIYFAHPTKEMLDVFENMIDQAGPCYVVVHYAVDQNWWIKSSKGHTFEDIMKKENIEVIFSGHFHPPSYRVVHHGQGGVEYVGAGGYQFAKFGVVTLDNNRFVYHTVPLNDRATYYLMTHPIPLDQLSSHQIFNEKDTEVRVISYDPEADNSTIIKMTGDFEGNLTFQRTLSNGAKLYSCPLKIPKQGKYKVKVFTDKFSIEREFFIGDSVLGERDLAICVQRGMKVTKITLIPFFISLLIVVIPIYFLV